MLHFIRVIITLVFFTSLASHGKDTDILKIYNQFTAVSAASGKCLMPPKKELNSFLANYQMVTTLMYQEIRKRKPDFSKEQINKAIVTGSNKVAAAVYKVIETESCNSPKIQDLIKRFHVQAKWKP